MVQRLTKEQILALTKPHSDKSQSYKCLGKNGEFQQSNVKSQSTSLPDHLKCSLISSSNSEKPKQHKEMRFSCEVCGKIFHIKHHLNSHMLHHNQARVHACDVPDCSYSTKVPNDLQRHKKIMHTSILYTCLLCGKNIKNYYFYKLHVAKHGTETPGVVKCLHLNCKKLFENGDELQKHTKTAHEDVKKLQCNECGKCFALKGILASHIVTHWDWQHFKCNIPGCSFSAKRSNHLQRHKNGVHSLDRFTCSLCGEMFKSRVYFKQHEEKHKTDTPGVFKCHHMNCQEIFSAPIDLRTHMEQHKLQKCDVPGCLFTCKVIRGLNAHRRKVHSIWSHNCQLCGKGFEHFCHLMMHLKCHETGEPGVIKCAKNNCKQTFTSIANLKIHLDNHESLFLQQNVSKLNTKKLECQLCGKIIKSNIYKLQKHILKHETDTPGVLKCIFKGCNKIFVSAAELKQHTFKHWDLSLRPFACDFPNCNHASRNKISLYHHKRQVHSPNLYTCDLCGRQYKNLTYVSQHLKRFHQKQLGAENINTNTTTVLRTNTAKKLCELVFKDEIEEVVFD
jgi:KRAB domain-containing zinc finger protein